MVLSFEYVIPGGGALHVLWLEPWRHQIFPIWSPNTLGATRFLGKMYRKLLLEAILYRAFYVEIQKKSKSYSEGSAPRTPRLYLLCLLFVHSSIQNKESYILACYSSFIKNSFYNQSLLIRSKFTRYLVLFYKARYLEKNLSLK